MADQNSDDQDKKDYGSKSLPEMFNHAGDLSKAEAIKILSDHLAGSWDTLTEDDLDMSILRGGFVNRLFVCENKKLVSKPNKHEPSKVLLRLMGGKLLDKFAKDNILAMPGEVVESLLYVLMSQANLGPQIYGVFSGGRIEEFIPSRIPTDADLMNPKITGAFARKLARIHNMSPPIVKKPKFVVFSLNDLNRANCIVREGPGTETMDELDKVIIIDYEFCSFCWRGSDIGQHFHNRTVDVSKMASGDLEYQSGLKYPSEEERRYFIQEYLDEVHKLGTYQMNAELDSVETVLIETEFFGLLWNVFFIMWMIRDHSRWVGNEFGGSGHMTFFLADLVRTLKERKERFLDLNFRSM